ncbi:STAS domain-containing protein [Nocardioides sp. SYSU D00038]|uniref:STAS domain-containing protein n=1 Tax=Nocardioides sp. SYSU D00038 TaxID=2812554 RepID=UPI0019688425|nr:STAS domain-containing protein [Nocardioides sp. SYSU D00038]
MQATFTTTYEPPVATLAIVGELDIVSRGRLAWRLAELTTLGCRTVRLDVGRVTYVDGRSVRLIDQTRERLEARGATLDIIAASACFARVVTVGRFRRLAAACAAATTGSAPW